MSNETTKLPAKAGQLIKDHFSKIEGRFLKLKDEETFIKETSFAMQICRSNNMLKNAEPQSVLESVVNLAQTDLTLNPVLRQAYLIPYREGNLIKCRVEPSYQGLAKLVTDTGSAKSISAQVVFNGDDFEVEAGTSPKIIHKMKFKTKEVFAVYAVAVLSDGSKMFEVMTKQDVDVIREMSESYKAYQRKSIKSCIWVDHYEEMSKKTVVKRLIKYLPKTDMFSKLGQAVYLDNQDFGATDKQLEIIDDLIFRSAIQPEELEQIQLQMNNGMTREEAAELIRNLKECIPNSIESGNNYGATEAAQMVANKLNDPKA